MSAFLSGLSDRNTSIRKSYSSALGQLVKVSKVKDTFSVDLFQHWYMKTEIYFIGKLKMLLLLSLVAISYGHSLYIVVYMQLLKSFYSFNRTHSKLTEVFFTCIRKQCQRSQYKESLSVIVFQLWLCQLIIYMYFYFYCGCITGR